MSYLGRTITILSLVIMPYVSGAHAQSTKSRALQGIDEVATVVEQLDEDATACGLTENALSTSLKFILGQSRMRLVELPGNAYVYLQVTALANCAVTVGLSVNASVTIVSTGTRMYGAQIWSTGGISTGSRETAPRRTVQMIEQYAKQLVVDWNSVNISQ